MIQIANSCSQSMLRLKSLKINPFTVFLFLFFVFQAIAGIWIFLRNGRIFWQGPSISLGVFLFVFSSFAGWRIEISPEEISVVKLLGSRKTVPRSAITDYSVKTGWEGGDKLNIPYRRIELYTDKKSPPFMIPIMSLKNEDIQKLLALLPPKKETAETNSTLDFATLHK